MHGIIFDQLRQFTQAGYSDDAWRSMLASVPDRGVYFVSEDYPDEELEQLLSVAESLTGNPRNGLLFEFGTFIVPGLLQLYGVLLDPKWDLLEVLENVEGTIHRVVRLRHPEARPPYLSTARTGSDQVSILYDSPRKMCWLGKGIIQGLQIHYEEQVTIVDETCMHKGDDICTIAVRRRSGSF